MRRTEAERALRAEREAMSSLATELSKGRAPARLVVGKRSYLLPRRFRADVARLFRALAESDSVVVLPVEAHVTTQQAADLLGMSRQHVVRLVDAGKLPVASRKTGSHRRLVLADVLRFKEQRDAAARRASEIAEEFAKVFGLR